MFRIHSTRVGIYVALIGGLAAAVVSAAISERATDTAGRNPPPSQRAMIEVLGAAAPNPALGEEAQTFDRLVGTWDAEFSFPRPNGTISRKKGELHFGWRAPRRATCERA